MINTPSYVEVKRDLVAHMYGLAHTLDMQIRVGAGSAMLGLPEENNGLSEWPDYDDFDLSNIKMAFGLNDVYDYAFHAELNRQICDDSEDGNLGQLKAFLDLIDTHVVNGWFDEVQDFRSEQSGSGLYKMVNIGFARHALDIKSFVSLEDIALLANVSERSVRNAMHAEGNERLVTSRNSNGEITVNQQEALHWLRHCHDFKETVWTGSYAKEAIPQILSPTEIIPFIETRLADIYRGWGDGQFRYISGSQSIGWTEDQVKSLAEGSVKDINPDDCKSIARMIRVNPAWFTSQVMNAIFPEAMNQINPHTESIHPTYISPLDQENGTLSVELTDAGIRNGYIDIEIRYAQRFFPSDSFGSRGAGDEGKTVKLDHDGKNSPYITDFRVKTKTLVSPRKRFSAYFTEHKAKAGDVIRFEKIDERHYRLIFIARG